jgi:hypothetical protein
MWILPVGHTDKFDLIEIMVINGEISLDRAEELITTHPDDVESEWLSSMTMDGAFTEFNA